MPPWPKLPDGLVSLCHDPSSPIGPASVETGDSGATLDPAEIELTPVTSPDDLTGLDRRNQLDGVPDVPALAPVGLIDASTDASTRVAQVLIDPSVDVSLDTFVVSAQRLADGSALFHYGIVTEVSGRVEGAETATDTARLARRHPARRALPASRGVVASYPPRAIPPPVVGRSGVDCRRDASSACPLPRQDGRRRATADRSRHARRGRVRALQLPQRRPWCARVDLGQVRRCDQDQLRPLPALPPVRDPLGHHRSSGKSQRSGVAVLGQGRRSVPPRQAQPGLQRRHRNRLRGPSPVDGAGCRPARSVQTFRRLCPGRRRRTGGDPRARHRGSSSGRGPCLRLVPSVVHRQWPPRIRLRRSRVGSALVHRTDRPHPAPALGLPVGRRHPGPGGVGRSGLHRRHGRSHLGGGVAVPGQEDSPAPNRRRGRGRPRRAHRLRELQGRRRHRGRFRPVVGGRGRAGHPPGFRPPPLEGRAPPAAARSGRSHRGRPVRTGLGGRRPRLARRCPAVRRGRRVGPGLVPARELHGTGQDVRRPRRAQQVRPPSAGLADQAPPRRHRRPGPQSRRDPDRGAAEPLGGRSGHHQQRSTRGRRPDQVVGVGRTRVPAARHASQGPDHRPRNHDHVAAPVACARSDPVPVSRRMPPAFRRSWDHPRPTPMPRRCWRTCERPRPR